MFWTMTKPQGDLRAKHCFYICVYIYICTYIHTYIILLKYVEFAAVPVSQDKAAGEAPPTAQAPETTPEVTKVQQGSCGRWPKALDLIDDLWMVVTGT